MPDAPSNRQGVALLDLRHDAPEHERRTHQWLGERIAALLGTPLLGLHRDGDARAHYIIPNDTLIGRSTARELGIRSDADFFGGLVAEPFMATKAITHPLPGPSAHAPPGWSEGFAHLAGRAVLGGYSAFNIDDAMQAGIRLLLNGPLRVKPVRATAGRGQCRVTDDEQLREAIALQDLDEIATWGLVLEEQLEDVVTYSVGQVQLAGITASYFGTQSQTEDNAGTCVYGGSELVVARGGWQDLLSLAGNEPVRLAIEQARAYEQAAQACFPGFIASRRNYDIAQGINARGQLRSGVLEQSWRIGGASAAEVLAIEAFAADPALTRIRTATVERYGDFEVPGGAALLYRGHDAEVGPIVKFARVEPYGDAQ
ncbi:DUF3182 family protein [Pseudomonas sp. No.21]|uniref:DUF3182 family protein n=1 Tax=Pseudomonas tohonis TaxID=2725477 RepID=UPI001F37544B|nr:DUF3182 family protein [Pseudomonas tohonis]GJN48683.1 hypothetical protein TUM20249_46690 [Pseudomonas tohonis]